MGLRLINLIGDASTSICNRYNNQTLVPKFIGLAMDLQQTSHDQLHVSSSTNLFYLLEWLEF